MRNLEVIADSTPFYMSQGNKVLLKAVEEDDKWNVYLEASNEVRDQEKEVTLMKALKEVSDYYLTHGVISYDHKHKELNDPGFIIGEPVDLSFTKDNRTLIKGFLYKENKIAQSLWQNLLSNSTRFGSSIGGYILQKSKDKVISKVYWDETAITHKPVNDATQGLVSTLPFEEFMKALFAGQGVNAEAFTGGRALTPENLVNLETGSGLTIEGATELFNKVWIACQSGEITNYNSLLGFIIKLGYTAEVAKQAATVLYEKLPALVSRI